MAVSDYLKDKKIDAALDQLDDEKFFGCSLYAFAKTVVDRPEVTRKISCSYSGHAADLQIRCTLRELELWNNRVWDKGGNSLIFFAKSIEGRSAEIESARARAHPDWPVEHLQIGNVENQISKFCAEVREISSSDLWSRMRVRRDEHLAHLIQGESGFGRKRRKLGLVDGYTYNEVLPLTLQTIELICRAFLIWRFCSHDYENTIRIMRKYYERYWRLFPNLSEAEARERLDD